MLFLVQASLGRLNHIPVTDDNDHLGLIMSGMDEDNKNVEMKLKKGRKLSLCPTAGASLRLQIPTVPHCTVTPLEDLHDLRHYIWTVFLTTPEYKH